MTESQQAEAVAALQRSLGARRIETHISYVLLADGQAWKIKKAVDLGFLDFSTLRQREFYCREELRLNRRTAARLYLEVVPLTGTPARPKLGGHGTPIDWALHMREFDQAGLWDRMADTGTLRAEHIDAGIEALCALHNAAAVAAPDAPFGQPAQVRAPLLDSLAALRRLCSAPQDGAQLDALAAWEADAFARLQPALAQRAQAGRVRECHGDLHLGNITQFEGRTTLFDCLEFSAALRWTDVMSDLAFIGMDLQAHGLPRLAQRWINGHIERSGDHDGLQVLRYYQVHRALVRAKVAALRDAQRSVEAEGHAQSGRKLHHYLKVALDCSRARTPVLMVTHGFSGSGKTTSTQSLLELCGAIRIRSDVERKRLFGLAPLARSDKAASQRLYGAEATQVTHERLHGLAELALRSGYSVILDATFLARSQRDAARALADRLGVPWLLLDFRASEELLRQRVAARAARADDASDAGLAVLEQQLAQAQPLQADELADAFVIDAAARHDDAAEAALWAPLLRRIGPRTAAASEPAAADLGGRQVAARPAAPRCP